MQNSRSSLAGRLGMAAAILGFAGLSSATNTAGALSPKQARRAAKVKQDSIQLWRLHSAHREWNRAVDERRAARGKKLYYGN